MLGLMMKDILVGRKYFRSILYLLVFYVIFGAITNNMQFGAYMMVFISTLLIFTVFSYDEMAKWDNYALSLPVKRSELVMSKYILAYLGATLGTSISLISTYVYNIINDNPLIFDDLLVSLVILELSIIVISLTIPFIYKYGIEKGRIALFVILGVPSLTAVIIAQKFNLAMPSDNTIKIAVSISPVITALLACISIYGSVLIYNKKEV